MPRFFFHVYDDIVARDDDGLELPDVAPAEAEALRGARSLASEQVLAGHLSLDHRIEVEDEGHSIVTVISFRDAVRVAG